LPSDQTLVVLKVKSDNIVPATVKKGAGTTTTYMPTWYVMQMLRPSHIAEAWDVHNWRLTTGNAVSLGTVSPAHL
jgi:hypothetical protein